MAILGIDYGTKRIGVALSHEDGKIAMPHCVINTRGSLKAQFGEIIEECSIEKMVMGNPLDQSGAPGVMSKKIKTISERLENWFSIECVLWDERYTSTQADSAARKSGSAQKKGNRDMAAATIILQSYLDFSNK